MLNQGLLAPTSEISPPRLPQVQYLNEDFRGLDDSLTNTIRDVRETARQALDQDIRLPYSDLFGIKRSECNLAGVNCPGYEPYDSIFSEGCPFVTFCKVCNCPAEAHSKEKVDFQFPRSLLDTFLTRKFTPNDLEFNSIVVVMSVVFTRGKTSYLSQIISQFLRRSGYTIVANHRRKLLPEEMQYLSDKGTDLNALRGPGEGLFSAESQVSLRVEQLKSLSNIRQKILSPAQKDVLQSYGQQIKRVIKLTKHKTLRERLSEENILKEIIQHSAKKGGTIVIPKKHKETIKIDPDAFNKESIILCLNSSLFHHLHLKFKHDYSEYQQSLEANGVSFLHCSTTKSEAIQDSLMFFPHIFQLGKSFLISKAYPEILPQKCSSYILNYPLPQKSRQSVQRDYSPELLIHQSIPSLQQDPFQVSPPTDPVSFNGACILDILNFNGASVLSSLDSKGKQGGISRDQTPIDRESRHEMSHYASIESRVSAKGKLPSIEENAQGFNIFAIAKVGFLSVSTPFNINVNLRCLSDANQFLRLSDKFFPSLGRMQRSVIIFRPLAVKSDIYKILKKILLINGFMVLHSQTLQLTNSQALSLAQIQEISEDNQDNYRNMMVESPVEILIVYKYGAVNEANVICNGCVNGRRSVASIERDREKEPRNLADFQIHQMDQAYQKGTYHPGPFSSITELINLDEYVALYSPHLPSEGQDSELKALNLLTKRPQKTFHLLETYEMLQSINYFERHFNVLVHNSMSEVSAEKTINLFFPQITHVQTCAVLLNPTYAPTSLKGESSLPQIEIDEFIKRMGFTVVYRRNICFTKQEAKDFFLKKFHSDYDMLTRLEEHFQGQQSQLLLLAKPGALFQIRALFAHFNINSYTFFEEKKLTCFEDKPMPLVQLSGLEPKIAMNRDLPPLHPEDFIQLFFVCDTSDLHEQALNLLNPKLNSFDGHSLQINPSYLPQVLEHILMVTLGQRIRKCYIDKKGKAHDFMDIQTTPEERSKADPKFLKLQLDSRMTDFEHFVVEAQHLGPYEVRIMRDLSGQMNEYDEYDRMVSYHYNIPRSTLLQILDSSNLKIKVDLNAQERAWLNSRYQITSHFQTLNLYYSAVLKQFKVEGYAPSFYQFRVMPSDTLTKATRVFECEEFMGEFFIERVAQDVLAYRYIEKEHFSDDPFTSERGSLPAFLWAQKLAQSCRQLEELKLPEEVESKIGSKGYGRIIWSKQADFSVQKQNIEAIQAIKTIAATLLEGSKDPVDGGPSKAESIKDKIDFFAFEKDFFRETLKRAEQEMKLSNSAFIIDQIFPELNDDLERVLRCEAYQESRKVKMLRFVPDRILEINIRSKQRLRIFDEAKFVQKAKEMENQGELLNIQEGTNLQRQKSPLVKEFICDIFLKDQQAKQHVPTRRSTPHKPKSRAGFQSLMLGASFEDQKTGKKKKVDHSKYKSAAQIAALTLFRKRKKGTPVVMQWSVAITNIKPAIRTKFHLIAGIVWLIDVRFRSIKRQEGLALFKGHEELYDRALDNMLEAIKQIYGDFAEDKDVETEQVVETYVEGVSFAKMETFLYGIREVDKVLNQIQSYKNAAIQLHQLILREPGEARGRKADLEMIQRDIDQLRQELVLSLKSLMKRDLFVDPSKLKGGRSAILIHRDRFFRPILYEKWEDDLQKEEYKMKVREFKFLPEFKKIQVVAQPKSKLEEDWYNQPDYKKPWLFQHDQQIKEWLAVKKREAKSEREYQEVVRRAYLEFLKQKKARS